MTSSKSLTRAEQLALEEAHESQDSQAILDALKAELGVGLLSSFPVSETRAGNLSELAVSRANRAGGVGEAGSRQGSVEPVRSTRRSADRVSKKQAAPLQAADEDVNDCISPIHLVAQTRTQREPDDAVIVESSPRGDDTRSSQRDAPGFLNTTNEKSPTVPPGAGRSQTKKMETSQQTPTQVNEDRDYGEFCNPLESSPPIVDRLRSSDEPQTLQANDTGAVNFGNLSPVARPSSQVSEDGGFENTRGEWREPDRTSQRLSSHVYTPCKTGDLLPETPALSKNPFGTAQSISAPFAGSQLFGQTPLPTSAAKVSPTSSRPSPIILHHSISPKVVQTSPLKNRANVSSPTDIRTSSPRRSRDVPATIIRPRTAPIPEETLSDARYPRDVMIPESPTFKPLMPSESRGPLSHYEPMKKSQERKSLREIAPMTLATDDGDDDDDWNDIVMKMERRKRVEREKAQAAKEMERVSFMRPARRNSGEAPRKRRKLMNDSGDDDAQQVEAKDSDQTTNGKSVPALRGSQATLIQSLEAPSAESTRATPGDDAADASRSLHKEDTAVEKDSNKETADEEMIPATSPVRSLSVGNLRGMVSASEPDLPALLEDESEKDGDDGNEMATSYLPLMRQPQRTYGKRTQLQRRNIPLGSSAASETASGELDPRARNVLAGRGSTGFAAKGNVVAQELAQGHSHKTYTENMEQDMQRPSSLPRSRSESIAPMMTRCRGRDRTPLTPLHSRNAGGSIRTSSSLTTLSITTPVQSSKTTPDTEASPESHKPRSISMPSPAAGRNMRNRTSRQAAKGKSPQMSTRIRKMATRSTRIGSESTDELQQSPPSSVLEMGRAQLQLSRVYRQSLGPTNRGRKLFEGMAFAISMQSDGPAQEKRRSRVVLKITQAGGLVLKEDFEDLFESCPFMSTKGQVTDQGGPLKLARSSLDCGFAALIADGHSRKPKYMQALALGLPCLAHQWITACLGKGAIVDWEPYLLAAGSSAALEGAVKSRCLQPYPAEDARLADIIEQRPRLLAGQNMLVVIGPKKRTKQQYLFLAQALGPSIYRASTIQQAREALRGHDKTGNPFNWLYIDKSVGTVESVLAPETAGKKRRRSSAAAAAVVRNIRVLHDELVIQSLILGRILDEDEMSS